MLNIDDINSNYLRTNNESANKLGKNVKMMVEKSSKQNVKFKESSNQINHTEFQALPKSLSNKRNSVFQHHSKSNNERSTDHFIPLTTVNAISNVKRKSILNVNTFKPEVDNDEFYSNLIMKYSNHNELKNKKERDYLRKQREQQKMLIIKENEKLKNEPKEEKDKENENPVQTDFLEFFKERNKKKIEDENLEKRTIKDNQQNSNKDLLLLKSYTKKQTKIPEKTQEENINNLPALKDKKGKFFF